MWVVIANECVDIMLFGTEKAAKKAFYSEIAKLLGPNKWSGVRYEWAAQNLSTGDVVGSVGELAGLCLSSQRMSFRGELLSEYKGKGAPESISVVIRRGELELLESYTDMLFNSGFVAIQQVEILDKKEFALEQIAKGGYECG